ncbi:MAG TPA: transglycosylase SLT domain-containing protein [Streptosporangiaceae bacterium]
MANARLAAHQTAAQSAQLARAGAGPALADPAREFGQARASLSALELRWLARAERRAAARRAARRRAAAARLAAAQAAQQSQSQQAQQPVGGTAGTLVTPSGPPQQIALAMLGSFGWPSSQSGCLLSLWNAESGWNPQASNPASGAYGIPQALPGSKMASAGPDWQSDPATQIRWGLGYIRAMYGSPCGAWAHEQGTGSY